MGRVGCDRLCDLQAIFLVEVFAQYCAQRCYKTLSLRFENTFRQVIYSLLRLSITVVYKMRLTHAVAERTWSLLVGDSRLSVHLLSA